jgi:hypothetical protein
MPLTITQRPDQNTNWNAVFNPVVFKMQRKDYNITAVASSGGALQITVNANLALTNTPKGLPVITGSVLWVQTDNGVYNGAYTVVSCTNVTNSVITFGAGTYISAATTGFVNLQQRTGYYVAARVFAGNGVVSSSALFTMNFTPNKSGALLMDFSQLKTYLNPLISTTLISTSNSASGWKTISNPSTSYKAHIQYTEVWTSSAETEVSDSANPFFVTHSARRIRDTYGGYMKPYSDSTTTRKFLNRFAQPRCWLGKEFFMSYIDPSPNGTSRTYLKKTRYDAQGLFWGATYDLGNYASGTPNPSIFDNVDDFTSVYRLQSDIQDASGTFSWTGLTYTGTPSATAATGTSNGINYFMDIETTHVYTIKVNVTVATAAVTINLKGKEYNGSNTFSLSQSAPVGTTTLTFQGTPSVHCHLINLSATMTTTATATINSVTIESIPDDGWIDYQLVTMTSTYTIVETPVSESLRVYLSTPCSPSVQLIWKNSLGGDSTWVFQYNQESELKASKEGVYRTLKLFADDLTDDEANAMSDLLSSSDPYQINITELTSSVYGSQAVNGKSVYAIDSDGSVYSVILVGYDLTYETRKRKNQVTLTIQLPELFMP